MIKILLLFIFVFSIRVFSQDHIIGIKTGISSSNVITKDFFDNDDRESRSGFYGNLFYQYMLGDCIYTKVGVTYSQRGFMSEIFYVDYRTNSISYLTIHFNYDYLAIPIVIGYQTKDNFYFFGNIGFLPSFLVSAKTKKPIFDQEGKIIGHDIIDVKDRVTKFDYGGLFEVGVGYNLNNSYIIFSSLTYNQSFNTITNSKYFLYAEIRHYSVSISVGLNYKIFKESINTN